MEYLHKYPKDQWLCMQQRWEETKNSFSGKIFILLGFFSQDTCNAHTLTFQHLLILSLN